MSELKPCPFCGSGEVFYKHALSCEVECDNCGASMHSGDWNTRPVEDELRAELARRDEIIARLKEDAGRLAFHSAAWNSFDNEFECVHNECGGHGDDRKNLSHSPYCPVTLHRALMKELEQ